jgi:beta-mannosidase
MDFPLHPRIDLNGSWLMAYGSADQPWRRPGDLESPVPAIVPGNFELDLLAAGLIPEPFEGLNIADLQRLEHHHVWYARTFAAEPRPGFEAVLRFEGLDCCAEIILNGHTLGRTDNALIEHELAVDDALLASDNELLVHLSPALEAARDYEYGPGLAAMGANVESLHVRKAPSCYGWDIMARALSAGLWRPVSLVYRPLERLDQVWLQTRWADEGHAELALHFRGRMRRAGACYELAVEGQGPCGRFEHRQRVLFEAGRVTFGVSRPALWWPRGRGEAHLYDVSVRLLCDGAEIDRAEFRHGIRTVRLERTSITDSQGKGQFCFWVNGQRTFVFGSNWVPADAYHSRDAGRVERMLDLAVEVGCNLLRCWGGNVYESEAFFDGCDQRGLLIWQDFAMACAVYPQDAEFQRRLAVEATAVVRRLRQHACLALWAGDNECDQAYGWGGYGDPNQNVLTRQVLPAVLAAEDPGRPYLPSSPYIDSTAYAAGEAWLTENHLWGPRDGFKSSFYLNALCHFASEIGYHGCPAPSSVRRFISPHKLWPPDNDEWRLHCTSPVPGVDLYDYRVALMRNQIREFFGVEAGSLEEFAELSQYVQAEAKKFFVELFRATKWRRTGIVWWNLIDGWPQFSDAVVDYYFEPKLAFETLRRSQQRLCLLLAEPENWRQRLLAANDTRGDLEVAWRLREVIGGAQVAAGTTVARADAITELASIEASAGVPRFYVMEWQSALGQGINHYLAATPPIRPADYRRWLAAADLGLDWAPRD